MLRKIFLISMVLLLPVQAWAGLDMSFKHQHKQDFDPTDTIIRITLDTTDDMWFYIAFVNLMFRAFGGFDQQLLLIDSDVRNSNARLRNDFYSKFNEREIYVKEYPKFTKVSDTIPIFEFPFECFYSIDRFCTKLSELSTFLNCTFFINEDFYSHWKKFIDLNQGWQSYVKCRDILEKIFSNKDSKINCSIIEQAWINYNLTKICKIFSGPMFDEDSYPENCRDIYAEIQKQLSKRR